MHLSRQKRRRFGMQGGGVALHCSLRLVLQSLRAWIVCAMRIGYGPGCAKRLALAAGRVWPGDAQYRAPARRNSGRLSPRSGLPRVKYRMVCGATTWLGAPALISMEANDYGYAILASRRSRRPASYRSVVVTPPKPCARDGRMTGGSTAGLPTRRSPPPAHSTPASKARVDPRRR